jgi:hypothetical protein
MLTLNPNQFEAFLTEDKENYTLTYKLVYIIFGRPSPASVDGPAETPELEILEIIPASYINEDGEEIQILEEDRGNFPSPELSKQELEVHCWAYYENKEFSYE